MLSCWWQGTIPLGNLTHPQWKWRCQQHLARSVTAPPGTDEQTKRTKWSQDTKHKVTSQSALYQSLVKKKVCWERIG